MTGGWRGGFKWLHIGEGAGLQRHRWGTFVSVYQMTMFDQIRLYTWLKKVSERN